MKYLAAILLLFSNSFSFSQITKNPLRTSSWYTKIYKISAAELVKFHEWDSIPVAHFLQSEPYRQVFTDSLWAADLPIGNYVSIKIRESDLVAKLLNVSNLIALPVNNKNNLQIYIRNKNGGEAKANAVFVNGKKIHKNKNSATFYTRYPKNKEEVFIEAHAATDTLFTSLSKMDDLNYSIAQQRRRNYRQTKIYKILNWVPHNFYKLTHKTQKEKGLGTKGFIVFNQPKFKPLDTVKFKLYAINRKGNPFSQKVKAFINYYARGKYYNQFLETLEPTSAGSYNGSFVLADSIPSDINVTLNFKNKKDKQILGKSFSLEDYVLDDIGAQEFKADKKLYYRNDSMVFSASAKDANGLHVMDASAKLFLLTQNINKFYADTLFVADTLYVAEKPLLTTAETKFSIPTNLLPNADLNLRAIVVFKNSNGELQEKSVLISYKYFSKEIVVEQFGDSLKIVYQKNGIELPVTGSYDINFGEDKALRFPTTIKIDPIAEDYNFYLDSLEDVKASFSVPNNYSVILKMISNNDMLGFVLGNPYEVPVFYSVFNGTNIVAEGSGSGNTIKWQKKMQGYRQMYKVRWQYYWAGEEHTQETNIGLLFKTLQIEVSAAEKIFPGQKDSLKIKIADYKGRPAKDVNLTVVSYNNQFAGKANVSDPPYLAKYKAKKFLMREGFESDDPDMEIADYKYPLGRFKKYAKDFGLDTMTYFKFLLPEYPYTDVVTPIRNIIPQLSVNVVADGRPQEIYVMYINKQMVYYNGTTVNTAFAFNVYPKNVQLVIRLKDKILEIDSLYFQPYYKHDISFDLDHLPANAKVTKANNYWSEVELNLLENSLFKMEPRNYYDSSFVWQNNKVFKMGGRQNHVVGPFAANEMLQFYKPRDFDISFIFEPGHEYRLSKNMVRLVKKPFFTNRAIKNYLSNKTAGLKLFDTLQPIPVINYKAAEPKPFLNISANARSYNNSFNRFNVGKLLITKPKDSVISYLVLERGLLDTIILWYSGDKYYNIKEGDYRITLVTSNFTAATSAPVTVSANGTLCLNMEKVNFQSSNSVLEKLKYEALQSLLVKDTVLSISKEKEVPELKLPDSILFTKQYGGTITGIVKDAKGGNPIAFAAVTFKGFKYGVITDANGMFSISNIRAGDYKMLFNIIGYEPKEIEVEVENLGHINLDVRLEISNNDLDEVIVVGYGMAKRTMRSASSVIITSTDNALQGKVAGVVVNSSAALGRETNIRLRGENSISNNDKPIYIVDGILYEEDPALDASLIKNITVLKGMEAAAIYGARAMYGAIVITTNAVTARKDFRDYAFWIPDLTTDKNGMATAEVVYPDNATGWKSYVLAIDKKQRVGKTSFFTQSYKPLMAQLALPTFLLEGDTTYVIGKALNYTKDDYVVEKKFSLNGISLSKKSETLKANESNISSELISSNKTDSLLISFGIESTTGFKDAESKKIPVFRKGIEETAGDFWILQNDTSVSFQAINENAAVSIYAQNNTLEMLLKQLDFLRDYPYYCMEQIASKVTGLSLEKLIKEKLGEPFKDQKELDKLLSRLQKSQLYDGGWAWWENGKANFQISNYVTNALLNYRSNPLVEANIRNAFLYLNNRIPSLTKAERLMALSTLSAGKHEMNYKLATKDFHFDSLAQHQQWQLVKIFIEQSLPYDSLLNKLIAKAVHVLPAGVHWGTENYRWYDNSIATTVLAYEVLSNEGKHPNLLKEIIQYFLAKTYNGYWRNTVEAASIIKTILPDILKSTDNFRAPAQLQVSGDTSFTINKFPFEIKNSTSLKNIRIKNAGGGMVYLTAYEKFFNKTPEPVVKDLQIKTYFEKNGRHVEAISFGEKVKMIIEVEAKKEAEFILLQVPIPAGCLFSNKTNNDWSMHKEYNKDKLQLFAEFLSKGTHRFEVALEPRYNGTYTLNPAKVELMYFPTFYGRNRMKKVIIKAE